MRYLLFLLLIPQCKSAGVSEKDFTIRVEISSFKDSEKFYLEYNNTNDSINNEITESQISSGNTITFKGKIAEPGVAVLYRYKAYPKDLLQQLKKITGIPDDIKKELDENMKELSGKTMKELFSFFLMPGKTVITAKGSLYTATIDGPKEVLEFDSLQKEDKGYVMHHLPFRIKFQMDRGKMDDLFNKKMMKAMDSLQRRMQDQVYFSYARKNLSSPLALYALKESVPVQIDSADKYLQLLYRLPSEVQHWPSAVRFKSTLEAVQNTEISQNVKDFKQTDSLGTIVSFSSFKGRYVLLDLWASWCIPCRRKHPQLLTVFKKYSRENFTILGIALEQKGEKSKWLKAIQQDKLMWTQVTDFKGWENDVARQFGVRSIPFNLLVNPEGKIIDKNLSPSDLEKRLAEIFRK